ncbi:hypothetical protein A2U01_0113084, partial [Trifolium medium]|nr:hypothetical protein [Trifolium medium]MCI91789.1 hypothetical protein [Trifolium medium]
MGTPFEGEYRYQ